MTRAGVALLATLSLAGCAGLQATDTRAVARALTAAGFQAHPADTPEKLVQLRSFTQGKVLWRPQDGQIRYVYADPARCKCLYVGGDEQYVRLRRHEAMAVNRFFAEEARGTTTDWGLWENEPR